MVANVKYIFVSVTVIKKKRTCFQTTGCRNSPRNVSCVRQKKDKETKMWSLIARNMVMTKIQYVFIKNFFGNGKTGYLLIKCIRVHHLKELYFMWIVCVIETRAMSLSLLSPRLPFWSSQFTARLHHPQAEPKRN